jgi:hypothetical protein
VWISRLVRLLWISRLVRLLWISRLVRLLWISLHKRRYQVDVRMVQNPDLFLDSYDSEILYYYYYYGMKINWELPRITC